MVLKGLGYAKNLKLFLTDLDTSRAGLTDIKNRIGKSWTTNCEEKFKKTQVH